MQSPHIARARLPCNASICLVDRSSFLSLGRGASSRQCRSGIEAVAAGEGGRHWQQQLEESEGRTRAGANGADRLVRPSRLEGELERRRSRRPAISVMAENGVSLHDSRQLLSLPTDPQQTTVS